MTLGAVSDEANVAIRARGRASTRSDARKRARVNALDAIDPTVGMDARESASTVRCVDKGGVPGTQSNRRRRFGDQQHRLRSSAAWA